MPVLPTEEPPVTLPGFAEFLSSTAPDVFGTTDDILDVFNAADEEFCNNPAIWLSPVCTGDDRAACWAINHQPGWNNLFNRRGVELVQLHRGTFTFRTLDVDPDDLPRDDDVKFLCLYLWLLRQHRCITGVTLYIPVLAPRHQTLFTSLLRLTEYVQKCEIHGCDQQSASSLNEQPRFTALSNLSMLTELGLAAMQLSEADGSLLVDLAEKNSTLVALILIDVQIEARTFTDLVGKMVEHKRLADFRLKMAVNEPVSQYIDALSQLGKASLSRLHIDVDCNLLPLLQGLSGNESLVDVTIETTIVDVETLTALAEMTNTNAALKRLKAKVDLKKFPQVRGVLHELFRLAGSSKLHTLVLSGSTLASNVMNSFADGVAINRSLKELHLDDCGLSCADVLPFVRLIGSLRNGIEEVNVGSLKGSDQERLDLLKRMMGAKVLHKITCVYHDCQLRRLREAIDSKCRFWKLSLEYGPSSEAEPVLRSVRSILKTLTTLSIITQQPLSVLGGQFLAYILRNSEALKVVRLRCPTPPSSAIQILKGLATSKSVAVVTIEHWNMKENVQRTFVDTLRQNRSINRLEFYWNGPHEYATFKEALQKGLALNTSVSAIKMYQGEQQHDEFYDHDLLKHLHRNEMILSWTQDIILRDGMCLEGAVLLERLKYRDATLDKFDREADFSPQTAVNRVRAALMATRSAFHALVHAFGTRRDFNPTPDGRSQLDCLARFIRDEVMAELGSENWPFNPY